MENRAALGQGRHHLTRKTLAFITFVILLLLFIYSTTPFLFTYMASGLDPSWIAASAWAKQAGLAFGSEFIFTAGPLSILYHRYFDPDLAVFSALVWLLCAVAAAFATIRLVLANKADATHLALAAAIVLLISPFYVPPRDSLLYLPCLLLPASVAAEGRSKALEILLPFVAAAFSLAKFSVFPLAVFVVVAADLMQISRRRFPLCTAAFGLGIVGLFLATGGTFAGLVPFLVTSAQVASGYTPAMAINGPAFELIAWLSVTLLFFGGAAWEKPSRRRLPFYLLLLALAAYLWICLKAGFVRHDIHSIIAWAGLSAAAMIWALRAAGLHRAVFALFYTLIAISAALFGHLLRNPPDSSYAPHNPIMALGQGLEQMRDGFELIRSPASWLAARQAQQDKAVAAVKAAQPLPPLQGTVDMIPSAQSGIIANGLAYRPRPTIQEYTTYSRALIAYNRDFFTSGRAPDVVLFQPGSIDGRHPASAEGPLWPLLMTRYKPVEMIGDDLLLKRRSRPLDPILGSATSASGSFEGAVAFPRPGQPAFVSIDVRPNWLGRLASILFKPPELHFELTFQDATTAKYRLIPDISREGTVLAPTITNSAGFGQLASGIIDGSPAIWPVSVRVTGGRGYRYFYDPVIRFHFASIDVERLRAAATDSRFVSELLDRIEDLRAAKSRLISKPGTLFARPESIFAQAPSAITVPTPGASRMRLAFGIHEGAYTGQGQSDGVCFRLRLPDGGAVLFERCLDPRTTAGDRGVVEATVELPVGTDEVVAETTCRANCNWDWSYWTRIRPDKP